MRNQFIQRVSDLLGRVTLDCLGTKLTLEIDWDKKYILGNTREYLTNIEPRVYVKVMCFTACRKTGQPELQHGRKWYLSEFMTDDEIIKTAFAAFERFVAHEAKEGFKIDGKVPFNPHTDFEELLRISDKEIKRQP